MRRKAVIKVGDLLQTPYNPSDPNEISLGYVLKIEGALTFPDNRIVIIKWIPSAKELDRIQDYEENWNLASRRLGQDKNKESHLMSMVKDMVRKKVWRLIPCQRMDPK